MCTPTIKCSILDVDVQRETCTKVFEEAGIRPSYSTGHPTENAVKNLKRKYTSLTRNTVNSYRKGLEAGDQKIWEVNSKIQEAYNRLSQARNGVNVAAAELLNCNPIAHATRYPMLLKSVERAEQRLNKEKAAYRKEVEAGKLLVGTGSGQTLPSRARALERRVD
ncbi:hypothetical protein B0H11DRAFT_1921797 [Mycena galericulata]|nr:hypothetical protein B0H11DRAFT_1921797 [Mycena galericulata]